MNKPNEVNAIRKTLPAFKKVTLLYLDLLGKLLGGVLCCCLSGQATDPG